MAISYFYFSTNTATRNRSFQFLDFWNVLIFFIIEVGILWLLVAREHKADLRLYAVGGMLLLFPFIKFGNGHDFVMRASLAPLFVLMVWCGETLLNKDIQTLKKYLLLTCLLIGSLTPIYEINRSIYRTVSFYLSYPQPAPVSSSDSQHVTHLTFHGGPETDHPSTLSADSLQTLGYLEDTISKNFLGKIQKLFFYKYLSNH